ncbi:MAG: hypothetical protein MPW15_12370 [Candidatus Manganitrophus sp.]|nr:hypothetical protein [Candidatus Manganitrophus sp.]
MLRKAISILILTLLLVSCVTDEIKITMIPNGDSPAFRFKYVRGSGKVYLSDLTIKEAESGLIVWQIRTFDPSLIFEERDGRRMPKNPRDIDFSKLKTVPIRQITFGVVPEGFNQYYPPNNEKPTLRSEVKYFISAGGGTGGKTEFTLEKECRKISVTSFSINDPDFTKPNAC